MKNIPYYPTNYPSDLTDAQWEKLSRFFPLGSNSKTHKRSLLEAVLYLIDNGCKWRALPHDYPKWSTVKSFYYRAIKDDTWKNMIQFMSRDIRIIANKAEDSSHGLIDS